MWGWYQKQEKGKVESLVVSTKHQYWYLVTCLHRYPSFHWYLVLPPNIQVICLHPVTNSAISIHSYTFCSSLLVCTFLSACVFWSVVKQKSGSVITRWSQRSTLDSTTGSVMLSPPSTPANLRLRGIDGINSLHSLPSSASVPPLPAGVFLLTKPRTSSSVIHSKQGLSKMLYNIFLRGNECSEETVLVENGVLCIAHPSSLHPFWMGIGFIPWLSTWLSQLMAFHGQVLRSSHAGTGYISLVVPWTFGRTKNQLATVYSCHHHETALL